MYVQAWGEEGPMRYMHRLGAGRCPGSGKESGGAHAHAGLGLGGAHT